MFVFEVTQRSSIYSSLDDSFDLILFIIVGYVTLLTGNGSLNLNFNAISIVLN